MLFRSVAHVHIAGGAGSEAGADLVGVHSFTTFVLYDRGILFQAPERFFPGIYYPHCLGKSRGGYRLGSGPVADIYRYGGFLSALPRPKGRLAAAFRCHGARDLRSAHPCYWVRPRKTPHWGVFAEEVVQGVRLLLSFSIAKRK